MTELKRTPLHQAHVQRSARMVPFAGYEMPVQYEGVVKEHLAVRSAAGVFDVSHMGELFFSGSHAAQVIDELVTGDIVRQPIGKALYTIACNEKGTILDDLIVYRLAEERFMVVCNASNREKIVAHFAKAAKGRVDFEDASDRYALLALQGPKAMEILALCEGGSAFVALPSFSLAEGKLAGADVIVARTGYTGEDGVEIFCLNEKAEDLWNALFEKGTSLGLVPAGLGARDTLRLEGRLSLYGNDIDETTNPLEAGLGWVVKLEKKDFLGKDALVAIKEHGLSRKIVGFQMAERGIARHGYPIVNEAGERVGEVTSGSPAPSLGTNIGLGYVPSDMASIGSRIFIEIRGQKVAADVVKTPFYKRPKI